MSSGSNKSKKSNKMSFRETNQQIMRKSTKKFFKSPPNGAVSNAGQSNQIINLADRITFSNFNKDGQFIPFNIEQQNTNQ